MGVQIQASAQQQRRTEYAFDKIQAEIERAEREDGHHWVSPKVAMVAADERLRQRELISENPLHPLHGVTKPEKSVTSVTETEKSVTKVTPENGNVTPCNACNGKTAIGSRDVRLLDDVLAFITQYVAFPSPEFATVVAIWILHTWIVSGLYTTPRLVFSSPEKRSGKTRAQEVTALLCPNPVNTINVSPAYLFRKLQPDEGERVPTIFLDETDALFTGKPSESMEAVRGIVNAGYRRGATVGRAEIRNKQVETHDYPVFAPVCLAGIGGLPDTIEDRAVIVHMKRRKPGAMLQPFRDRTAVAQAQPLRERLQAWGDAHTPEVAAWTDGDYPTMPPSIQDRDADVWEPLFIVAQLVGGKWPREVARIAPGIIANQHAEPQSLGERLLRDIRNVFDTLGTDAAFTLTILGELCNIDDAPWSTLGKDDAGIDTRFLSRTLKPYDVGSHHGSPYTVRVGNVVGRGYKRADFEDAWSRYLPPTNVENDDAKEPEF